MKRKKHSTKMIDTQCERSVVGSRKPIYENEAFVARAKKLEQELESSMLCTRAGDALDDGEAKIEEGKAEG
jgi:predicted adenine nucleotide alpha hydrolase (AANH) superfamily ATPase